MKDFIQHAFDIFGYVIPGLFVIFSLSLLDPDISSIADLKSKTENFDAGIATVLVIVAYVIGFMIYPIGRILYKGIGLPLFGNTINDDSNHIDLSVPTKYALLRELSPSNFKYVESWNIYCAMAHNLMVACLIFSGVTTVKAISTIEFIKFKQLSFGEFLYDILSGPALVWLIVSVWGIKLFVLLTYRAVTYFHWAAYDINATIKSLNLEEKAKL
ncbi:MAG: hypothetical protein HKN00_03485 [Flavobacteriaceae bacterium]|nr:hypothetical protein [Bacteroidia bacterium]MBT8287295.1 hypothetical protein [Bacteroidia bacterium]NNF74224.1 hypothetical protein [Flavobacteriaceae bacterium]NNK71734.1 hypothetical protein [Flavobacteriaceae bacterium]